MTVEVPIVDLASKDTEVDGDDDKSEDSNKHRSMDTDGMEDQGNTAKNNTTPGSSGGLCMEKGVAIVLLSKKDL